MFGMEMTHNKLPAVNLTSPLGAGTSKEGSCSDIKTEVGPPDIHRGTENNSPDPSVSLEEKERTRDRRPATSPPPAAPPLLIKAL